MTRFLLALALFFATPLMAQSSKQFDVTLGYDYQNSDQGEGLRTNLNGWFGSAQFDFTKTFALTAEMDNYYGTFQEKPARQQNFVVGPQLTFGHEKAKAKPFVYLQGGDQRSSSAGNVEHAFNLQLGRGFQLQISERFALQVTPAEYSLVTQSAGVTHSYGAKVGFTWTAWKSER